MIIYKNNAKEIIATSGFFIAIIILIFVSAKLAAEGGYNFILLGLIALLLIALLMGIKIAYKITQFIFGISALVLVSCTFNPFFYEDVQTGTIFESLSKAILLGLIAGFLCYCVGKHGDIRKVK